MDAAAPARIAALIDQLQETAASPANQARRQRAPTAIFALEEPIATTKIWGYDANRYFGDPLFYVEQTLRQKLWRWAQFPDDDAPITPELPAWLGHYPEYTLVGLGVAFDPSGVPLLQADHPLTRTSDLRLLRPLDFYQTGWMPRILRWYDDLQRIIAGRLRVTFNMTWWRGCLDLAIQLRGYAAFITDIVERPAFVHDLLRFLVEQRCRWWEGYYRHFGLPVQPEAVADDWINVPFITPGMFAEFVLPRYREIEAFHGGIRSVHSCGNQTPVQHCLLELKSLSIFEVSPWTDLSQSLRNLPPDKALAISLHPNDVLLATPQEMEARLRGIVDACMGRRYNIWTSGLTPLSANLVDFADRIRTWTVIARRVLDPLQSTG